MGEPRVLAGGEWNSFPRPWVNHGVNATRFTRGASRRTGVLNVPTAGGEWNSFPRPWVRVHHTINATECSGSAPGSGNRATPMGEPRVLAGGEWNSFPRPWVNHGVNATRFTRGASRRTGVLKVP